MEVILCACHGRIADRLPLLEIGRFLKAMAPDIEVLVEDDLCQRDMLHRLVGEGESQPLVVGACSRLRPRPYFWQGAGGLPVNPYATRIVDLLEEAAAPYDEGEAVERVKLLLWSQMKRASEFKGISQHNMTLRISPPDDKVTRRQFLTAALPRYEVIPCIEPSKCMGGDKCRLCLDRCPLQAISVEGDMLTVDASVCSGCGACVAVCPRQAVSYPTFSFEELDKEMEGLLAAEGVSLEPRIIALTCRTCLPTPGDGEGNRLRYPSNILPLEIPCLAMASPWLMLRAFDMGAQGLALISGREECLNGVDEAVWRDGVSLVRAVLDCWDVEAERVRLFRAAGGNWLDTERELSQFAREIARLGTTPLWGTDRTLASTQGPRLLPLIGSMASKLMRSPEGAIFTGTLPFGKVTLDATGCTGCGLCALNCPTDALRIASSDDSVEFQLLFRHDSCVACGACVDTCPEGCLELEHILELGRMGSGPLVLFHDVIVKCRRCGEPVAPKSMIDRLRSRLQGVGKGLGDQLELCSACKAGALSGRAARIGSGTGVTVANMDSAACAGAGRERTQ